MAVEQTTICAARHRNCKRSVSKRYAYYPYCWQHAHGFKDDARSALMLRLRFPPPRWTHDAVVERLARYYVSHGLNQQESVSVAKASEMWSNGNDMTIPANTENLRGVGYLELGGLMVRNGFPKSRLRVVEFQGIRRKTKGVREQHSPNFQHRAIALEPDWDNHSTHITVIDPVISSLAPLVGDARNDRVAEHFSSGETPYGESPYIGELEEYKDGAHLGWNTHQILKWE